MFYTEFRTVWFPHFVSQCPDLRHYSNKLWHPCLIRSIAKAHSELHRFASIPVTSFVPTFLNQDLLIGNSPRLQLGAWRWKYCEINWFGIKVPTHIIANANQQNCRIPTHVSNDFVRDHAKYQCQCQHCHTMSSALSEATKLRMFRLLIYCLCAIFLMNIQVGTHGWYSTSSVLFSPTL